MKKIISACLLFAMLLSLAACATDNTPGDTTAADTTVADTTVPEETTTAAPVKKTLMEATTAEEAKALGLDGYQFNIFTRMTKSKWTVIDIAVAESTGETLNDAVYKRQTDLQDRFGFTMKVTPSAKQHGDELATYVTSGDNTYDIAFPSGSKSTTFAMQGILKDLNTLKYFDKETDVWSKNYLEAAEWGNKLYFATGAISINAFRSARAFLFNKDLHSELKLDNLYNLVNEGKWTLDVMDSMAKKAASDLNGDGTRTATDDRWGAVWQSSVSGAVLYYGTGARITELDANGIPQLVLGDTKTTTVFDKISSIMSDSNTNFIGGDAEIGDIFKANRTLFYSEVLYTMETLRDSSVDFGIIPIPKYDEAQQSYYSYVDGWCASPVVVPNNAKSFDRSGFIIQLLAETGDQYIRSPYYDVCLSQKYARDKESVAMLDLVVNNISMDPIVLYGWAGLTTAMRPVWSDGSGLASFVATHRDAVATGIAETNASYQKLS